MASLSTHIWIFAVGRGSAAFVRTGLGQGFILDMGGGEFVDPVAYVRKYLLSTLEPYQDRKIAQAVLSHPHADHISQCNALAENDLYPALLTCPNDKADAAAERINWARLNEADPTKQPLIAAYRDLYAKRKLPLQTIKYVSTRSIPNLEYGIYYLLPATAYHLHLSDDNKYGNALSIMLYLRHGDHSILFPGDMTPEGMKAALDGGSNVQKRYTVFATSSGVYHPTWHEQTADQPSLKQLLQSRGLSVLVAPHHGLESCYSSDLFAAIAGGKPRINIISERRKTREGDGCTHACYQSDVGGSGLNVRIEGKQEFRRSVTTKAGHHILIEFSGSGAPVINLETSPEKLLAYA